MISTIIKSSLIKIIQDYEKELNEDELKHLLNVVNINIVPDRVLSSKERIFKNVCWGKVDKLKMIRVISRNINVADYVDFSKHSFSIKEIRPMIKIHPYLLSYIGIDLKNIKEDEAYSLLTIGDNEINQMVVFSYYKFSPNQIYEIIKSNNFSDEVFYKFDALELKKLNDYHVYKIIMNTDLRFSNLIDIKKVTAKKWVEILQNKSELFEYCDLNIFKKSDIYYSIRLIGIFPEKPLDFLILERNFQEISELGWEELIKIKPDVYGEIFLSFCH